MPINYKKGKVKTILKKRRKIKVGAGGCALITKVLI